MSLSEISLGNLVKKQFFYKLNAYTGVFSSMVLIQVIAIFFSFGAVSSGSGRFGVQINVDYHSADTLIIFTMLWAFINAVTIITKKYRDDDFAFVTNRVSNNVSNMLFLVAASFIGGVTAILSTFLIRVISYFVLRDHSVIGYDVMYSVQEIFSGLLVVFLYLLLFCALGYLAGTISQLHKSFVVLLPVVVMGCLIMIVIYGSEVLLHVIEFYSKETNTLLFVGKTVITSFLLFAGAIILSNRLEVRK
ncbi:hypothetical protein JOC34_002008 [Virgibacillus halotolerans]|uniref:hypothetical protein n=1 Tax=Virgibacillus halotolerans TaxID=1071053 RepID=UPI0019608D86|nr:hypothetical protein [Virgibacillus halotolerans]MBM7599640.1 hypothetical protein [Virgibacillus halotolerans]